MFRTVSDAQFRGLHQRLLTGSDPTTRTADLSTLARFLVERATEVDVLDVVASVRGMGFDFYVSGEAAPASACYELVRVLRGGVRRRRSALAVRAGAPFPPASGKRAVWMLRGPGGSG